MKTRCASLACFLFLLPPVVAQALALSDIEVRSHLNQPLDAQVRMLSLTKGELDSLQIKVVSSESSTSHVEFRPEIVQDDAGSVIRITTEDSVREPILMMRIELSWSTGHLTREYSLIIDPR
jgi:pilus assembly protein FimV